MQHSGGDIAQTGLLRQYGKLLGNRVNALQLAPALYGGKSDLLVGLQSGRLDVLVDCQASRQVKESLKSKVTCMTRDRAGFTWTGHEDGSIMAHRVHSDSNTVESKQLNNYKSPAAICAVAIDCQGRCWAGDAAGNIFIVSVAEQQGSSQLQFNWVVDGPGTGQPRTHVKALLCQQQFVFSTGAGPSIRVADCTTRDRDKLPEFPCGGYGMVSSLAAWQLPGPTAAVAGTAGSSSSSSWVLLSGHEGGRVVMWYFEGRGRSSKLHELKALGAATKDTTVVDMFPYPEWSMLVVAHSSRSCSRLAGHQGTLTLWQLPTVSQLLQGSTGSISPPFVKGVHEKQMVAATALGDLIVTASPVSVRAWSRSQLADEAAKQQGWSFVRLLPPVPPVSPAANVPGEQQVLQHPAEVPLPSVNPSAAQAPGQELPAVQPPQQEPCYNIGMPKPPPRSQLHDSPQQFALLQLQPPLGQERQFTEKRDKLRQMLAKQAAVALPPGYAPAQFPAIPEPQKPSGMPLVKPTTTDQDDSSKPGGKTQHDTSSSSTVQVPSDDAPCSSKTAAAKLQLPGAPRDAIIMSAAAQLAAPAQAQQAIHHQFIEPQKPGQAGVSRSKDVPPTFEELQRQAQQKQQQLQVQQQAREQVVLPRPPPVEPPAAHTADLAAELTAHCSHLLIKVLPAPFMYGTNRGVQARCNCTHRLRTLLQVPRAELYHLTQQQAEKARTELLLASDLHHPHLLQLQEVFASPVHLNIVLEECSAGRLVDFPAKHQEQAAVWSAAGPAAGEAPRLTPDFARWFFQQVVLAVQYYHAVLKARSAGELPMESSLSVKDTLLKVAPNLPQPVVKVPTKLLAQGLPAASPAAAAAFAGYAWAPPEGRYAATAVAGRDPKLQVLQAADVWACGVLLLVLLGGRPMSDGSSSGLQVLELLPKELRTDSKGSVGDLLQRMLLPKYQLRMTLEDVMQHPWFATSLPRAASDMTARFLEKGRVCKQSHDEIQTVLTAAAAAVAPAAATIHLHKRQPQQHQFGPVLRPEMLYCMQLQANALHQAYAGLLTSCQELEHSNSPIAAMQLLSAQQAATYTANSVQDVSRALMALNQFGVLQKQRLLMGQRCPTNLDMVLRLQEAVSASLYHLSKLHVLLQSSAAPGAGSLSMQGEPGGDAETVRIRHKLSLLQGRRTLSSLWRCSRVATAVVKACCRSAMPKGLQKMPQTQQLQRPQLPAAAAGIAAVVQHACGGAAQGCAQAAYKDQDQQQQQERPRHLVVVSSVEDMDDLVVEAVSTEFAEGSGREGPASSVSTAHSSASSLSGCFTYRGLLTHTGAAADSTPLQQQQMLQQQEFDEVQVVGLSPLFTPDYSKGLPAERLRIRQQRGANETLKAREQLMQQAAASHKGRWEAAADHLGLAYAAEACSADGLSALQHVLLQLQDRGHFSSIGGGAGADGEQRQPQLVPVHRLSLRPPLMVMAAPQGRALEEWMHSKAQATAAAAEWQSQLPLRAALQVLQDVAGGLLSLHQLQPPCVHGSIHAGSVQLLQQELPTAAEPQQQQQQQQQQGQVAQLSLVGLLKVLAPVSSCHPFLAAPEAALAAGPATPASDVYGFGMLMFQLASGWLPQQYTPGTDEQISAVVWCREMMALYGSTSPVAAAEAQRLWKQQQKGGAATMPTTSSPATFTVGTYSPYGGHLLAAEPVYQLQASYYQLMAQCLHKVPPARPCMAQVLAQLHHMSRLDPRAPAAAGITS